MTSRIWFPEEITLDALNRLGKHTMGEHLGMEFIEVGDRHLSAKMPVDRRTKQPYGLLHGGASVALAETLGSVASAMVINHETHMAVGLEINANHVKSARSGWVIGTCSPIHLGATTHVWDIKIVDEAQRLLCISRLTVAIIKRK